MPIYHYLFRLESNPDHSIHYSTTEKQRFLLLYNHRATVLGSVLGDKTNFTMVSKTPGYTGPNRKYTSFSEAAYENAD